MRIQILPLPSVMVGDDLEEPFALVFDQAEDDVHKELLYEFARQCGSRTHVIVPHTVDIVDRYADPKPASGEPAELATLPVEVRQLVHAVDSMRDHWAEADEDRRGKLWRAVHEACDKVWWR